MVLPDLGPSVSEKKDRGKFKISHKKWVNRWGILGRKYFRKNATGNSDNLDVVPKCDWDMNEGSSTYSEHWVQYLSSILHHDFPSVSTIDIAELFYDLLRLWKSSMLVQHRSRGSFFWAVQIATFLLASPLLLTWELVALCGLLILCSGKALSSLRRRQTWEQTRDISRRFATSDWVGILVAACTSTARGYCGRLAGTTCR